MRWFNVHWIIWRIRRMVMMCRAISMLVRVNVTILVSMCMQHRYCIVMNAKFLIVFFHVIIRILVIPVSTWMCMRHDFTMFILMSMVDWIVRIALIVTRYDYFWSF